MRVVRDFRAECIVEQNMTIGVFDMVINGTINSGSLLPALLHMKPSGVDTITEGTDLVYQLTFVKGDVYSQLDMVKNPHYAYALFHEILFLGRVPRFLTYERLPLLFDAMIEVCGMNFNTDHSVYEIIVAFLTRMKADPNIQKRLGGGGSSVLVPLKDVTTLATTVSSALLGSYFDSAVNSAIVNQSEQTTELEEIITR